MDWYLVLLILLPFCIILLAFLVVCCCHDIDYGEDSNGNESTTTTIMSDVERGSLQNTLQSLPALMQLPSYQAAVRRLSVPYMPTLSLNSAKPPPIGFKNINEIPPSQYKADWPLRSHNPEISNSQYPTIDNHHLNLRRTSYPPNSQINEHTIRSGFCRGKSVTPDLSPRFSYPPKPYVHNGSHLLRSASYTPKAQQPQFRGKLPAAAVSDFCPQNQEIGENWYHAANSLMRSHPSDLEVNEILHHSHSYRQADAHRPSSRSPYPLKPKDTLYI